MVKKSKLTFLEKIELNSCYGWLPPKHLSKTFVHYDEQLAERITAEGKKY